MRAAAAGAGRWSLAGKLFLLIGLDLLVVAAAAAGAAALGFPPWTIFLAAVALGAPVAAWSLHRFWSPVRRTLQAVTDGVRSFQEDDFSVRLAADRRDELGELVELYNRMGDAMRLERNEIYQRELMLDTLLQGAPMGILLLNELDRVVFANVAARGLIGGAGRLAGRDLTEVTASCPEPMRRALFAEQDTLFTVPAGEEEQEETYRVVRRRFQLNTQDLRLVVLERITPELRRQEVEIWKKVIRVMNHELNNSLAPVSSLLHSARHVAGRQDQAHRLDEILEAAEERVRHLSSFLEGYARFARLPQPRKEPVAWPQFLDGVQRIFPFRLAGPAPAGRGWFDPGQVQQVLINLLKNAAEAGSPPQEVLVAVERSPDDGALVHVLDRGKGMDDETMRKALLPFYSSKESGSGLGLPLCTEILSAHGGSLRLQRRPGGGMVVTCLLPPGS